MKKNKTAISKAKPAPAPKLYKIDKGIPLSEALAGKSDGRPGRVALTLQAMVNGDSFLIRDELEALKARKTVKDRNGRGDGTRFAVRSVKGGVRVWRVK